MQYSQVPRFKEVFNTILGQTMNAKGTRWQIHTVQDVPVVEKGESTFVVLKLAFLYNGAKFVEDLEDLTVSLYIFTYIQLLCTNSNNILLFSAKFHRMRSKTRGQRQCTFS